MNDIEVLKLFYESARTELIKRIKLRDSVVLLFLGLAGTFFGLALNSRFSENPNNDSFSVLLIIPYLSLGASVLLSQHNGVIAFIGKYCSEELQPVFDELTKPNKYVQWDNSKSLREFSDKAVGYRTFGHFILIFIPSIAALALNWKHAIYSPFPVGILWWFGLVFTIVSVTLIIQIHLTRKNIYKNRFPKSS